MSRRGRRRPLAPLLSILLLVAALLAVAGIGASVVRSGDERGTGARGAASPAKVRVATIAAVHDNPAPLYALETLRGVTACLLGE